MTYKTFTELLDDENVSWLMMVCFWSLPGCNQRTVSSDSRFPVKTTPPLKSGTLKATSDVVEGYF